MPTIFAGLHTNLAAFTTLAAPAAAIDPSVRLAAAAIPTDPCVSQPTDPCLPGDPCLPSGLEMPGDPCVAGPAGSDLLDSHSTGLDALMAGTLPLQVDAASVVEPFALADLALPSTAPAWLAAVSGAR